jgi:type II secretory pathway pseudopilin PulG
MKSFNLSHRKKLRRGGFSLVEATFSIGLLSCGFLTLAPLLALGFKTARVARDNQDTAQIASTLVEEAEQGSLVSGTTYLDFEGATCTSAQAAYSAQSTVLAVTGSTSLSQLTLRLTPLGAPDHARIYAVIFPTAP